MISISLSGRWLPRGVLSVFLFSNVFFAHTSESSFWEQRRLSARRLSTRAPAQLKIQNSINPFWDPFLVNVPASLGRFHFDAGPKNFIETKKIFADKNKSRTLGLSQEERGIPFWGLPPTDPSLSPVVLHIQDIHGNLAAQQSIGQLIEILCRTGTVDLIALEGTHRQLDFKPFRAFHNPRAVRCAADQLLKINQISGAAHAAFTGPPFMPPVWGIESPHLYRENVRALREALKHQERLRARVETQRHQLAETKNTTFNSSLLDFDREVQAYRHDRADLPTYLTAVEKHFAPGQNRPEDVGTLLKTLAITQSRLKNHPSVEELRQIWKKAQTIEPARVLKSLPALEKSIYNHLVRDSRERWMVNKDYKLYLLSKLIDFTLTSDQWRDEGQELPKIWEGENLSAFHAFYLHADARDRAMTTRLLERMKSARAKFAILVTGGYHSAGMDARLHQAGIETCTFTPWVEGFDPATTGNYLRLFNQPNAMTTNDSRWDNSFLALDPASPQAMDRMRKLIGQYIDQNQFRPDDPLQKLGNFLLNLTTQYEGQIHSWLPLLWFGVGASIFAPMILGLDTGAWTLYSPAGFWGFIAGVGNRREYLLNPDFVKKYAGVEKTTRVILLHQETERIQYVLLLKDSKTGQWELPGGGRKKVSQGDKYKWETSTEAALRETFEEAGIRLHFTRLAAVAHNDRKGNFFYQIKKNNKFHRRECFVYSAILKDRPDITLGKEHDSYKWVDLSLASQYSPKKMGVATRLALTFFVKQRRRNGHSSYSLIPEARKKFLIDGKNLFKTTFIPQKREGIKFGFNFKKLVNSYLSNRKNHFVQIRFSHPGTFWYWILRWRGLDPIQASQYFLRGMFPEVIGLLAIRFLIDDPLVHLGTVLVFLSLHLALMWATAKNDPNAKPTLVDPLFFSILFGAYFVLPNWATFVWGLGHIALDYFLIHQEFSRWQKPSTLWAGDRASAGNLIELITSEVIPEDQIVRSRSVRAWVEDHLGKVLLLKNKKGLWEFPGGGMNGDDNNPMDAIARELQEETQLSLDGTSCSISAHPVFYHSITGQNTDGPTKTTYRSVHTAKIKFTLAPRVSLNEESTDYRWVSYEELKKISQELTLSSRMVLLLEILEREYGVQNVIDVQPVRDSEPIPPSDRPLRITAQNGDTYLFKRAGKFFQDSKFNTEWLAHLSTHGIPINPLVQKTNKHPQWGSYITKVGGAYLFLEKEIPPPPTRIPRGNTENECFRALGALLARIHNHIETFELNKVPPVQGYPKGAFSQPSIFTPLQSLWFGLNEKNEVVVHKALVEFPLQWGERSDILFAAGKKALKESHWKNLFDGFASHSTDSITDIEKNAFWKMANERINLRKAMDEWTNSVWHTLSTFFVENTEFRLSLLASKQNGLSDQMGDENRSNIERLPGTWFSTSHVGEIQEYMAYQNGTLYCAPAENGQGELHPWLVRLRGGTSTIRRLKLIHVFGRWDFFDEQDQKIEVLEGFRGPQLLPDNIDSVASDDKGNSALSEDIRHIRVVGLTAQGQLFTTTVSRNANNSQIPMRDLANHFKKINAKEVMVVSNEKGSAGMSENAREISRKPATCWLGFIPPQNSTPGIPPSDDEMIPSAPSVSDKTGEALKVAKKFLSAS